MGRAPCCEKVGLNKGLWSAEEDEILRNYIEANGDGSWKSLPKNAGLNRCCKSCRLRWVNYLRGDLVRGNITSEEEDIIIKMYNKIGSRWSVIAGHLPGRTDNEIKNYWNTRLSRRIYTIKRPLGESTSSPTMVDIVKMDDCCKQKGRTRKPPVAMKKNNNIHLEIPTIAEKKDGPNSLERENAGITLNSSSEEIETIGCTRPFVYGSPENENLGPYRDLDQSCMLADDDIMSDDLSSLIDITSKEQIVLLVGSNGTAAAAGSTGGVSLSSNGAAAESTGGVSLSSNGAAAEAAESTNEWYIPSCLTSMDWQGVIDESRNYNLLTDEGDELLLFWL